MKLCRILIISLLMTVIFISEIPLGIPQQPYSYAQEKHLQEEIDRLKEELRRAQESGDAKYESLLQQYNLLLEKQKEQKLSPQVQIKTELGKGYADSEKKIQLSVINPANANFSRGFLSISSFPAGITLKGNSSTAFRIGELLSGQQKTAEFDLKIDKDVKSGNYPISFTWNGSYGTNNEQEYSFSQTFYMEIEGKAEEKKEPAKVAIQAITIPAAAATNQDFTLGFQIVNNGKKRIEALKISVEPSGNLVNKSRNIFIEEALDPGKSKAYSVILYAPGSTEEKSDSKNHPIKITVESSGAPVANEKNEPPEAFSISQYTGILILGNKGTDPQQQDGVKAPQLMVENYSYGGTYVEAGKNFTLNLTMLNTSREKPLRNIKIALNSDEGTFIPYNTSNSFFIDTLAPGGRASKSINFSTKPDAKAQTIALTLDSTYEDMKGNPLTAKDIISIPVVQTTKLDIDDAVISPDTFVGQPASISISFYNTGKNVLRNLKITSEGNFDVPGGSSYFAGNMEPGKSDSYDLQLIPKEVGLTSGIVTFSYEDVQGEIQTIEKTFDFTAVEMPPMDETDEPPMEPQKNSKMPYYLGGGVIAFLLVVIIIWRKRHKRKKEQEMDIDE